MTFIRKRKYYRSALIGSFIVLMCLIIFSSTMGAAKISFLESIRIVMSKIPVIGEFILNNEVEKSHYLIVLKIRMPRILLGALVGMGLSVVGSAFQGMFRNPMADPYVLGISSGAALGATAAIVLGLEYTVLGFGFITVCAFAGAILTTYFVYNIAKVGSKIPTVTLLLAGIAIGFLLSSIISIIMIFNRNQIENIVYWIMGSVSAASWNQVGMLFPVVLACTTVITAFSRELNIMSTGEETARSLGVNSELVKKVLLSVSSVLVAACVSVSGIIGFVGLIVPHIVRLILGSDHRIILPFSAVGGAIFMVVCDTMARTIAAPAEIPVGAVTSVFGAPFFIYLLIKSKRRVI